MISCACLSRHIILFDCLIHTVLLLEKLVCYRIANELRDIDLKRKTTILHSKVHRHELYCRLGEPIVTNLAAGFFDTIKCRFIRFQSRFPLILFFFKPFRRQINKEFFKGKTSILYAFRFRNTILIDLSVSLKNKIKP